MAPDSKKSTKKRQSSNWGLKPTQTAAAGQVETSEAVQGSGKRTGIGDHKSMQQPSITEALAGSAKSARNKVNSKSDYNKSSSVISD